MSLRKIAGLLATFGLAAGLIGGGVGAVWQDQVTATENISVGAISCEITSASPAGPNMVIGLDKKTVTYTPPTITNSAANATGLKFDFTVKNTGTIPANFTVDSPNTQGSQFATFAPAASGANPVAAGASIVYTGAGVNWGDLTSEQGNSYSFTWKVNCTEVPAVRHWSDPIGGTTSTAFPSTMAANQANGWPYATVLDSTITFQSVRQLPLGGSCMEYRFDNNVPDQIRHGTNSGNNWNPLVTDGLWPSVCIGSAYPSATATVAIPAGVTTFEVRSAFGAESGERFDWTRFNLLP